MSEEINDLHRLLEYFEKYEYDYYPDNALMGALLERGTVWGLRSPTSRTTDPEAL